MPNKEDKIITESVLESVLDKRFDTFEEKIDRKFSLFEDKMDKKFDERFSAFEEKIDRKFGVFIEQLNDQFSRVIEAVQIIVDARTEAIPRIEKKVEKMAVRLSTTEFEQMQADKTIGSHERRITKLEASKLKS